MLVRPSTARLNDPHLAETKAELFQYDGPLSEVDPEIAAFVTKEKARQVCGARLGFETTRSQTAASFVNINADLINIASYVQVRGLELIASENFTSRAVSILGRQLRQRRMLSAHRF